MIRNIDLLAALEACYFLLHEMANYAHRFSVDTAGGAAARRVGIGVAVNRVKAFPPETARVVVALSGVLNVAVIIIAIIVILLNGSG